MDSAISWVEVYASPARRACDEQALVLMALDIPTLLVAAADRFVLLVPGEAAPRAAAELARYAAENRPRPRGVPTPVRPGAVRAALAYALVLFLYAVAISRHVGGIDWADRGILDGAAVRAGERWRVLTALTEHADLGHLAANVGFGALFGALASRAYGPGVAWLAIVVAAALANFANALWMAPGQASLGASTAVFAALGALAVHRWPAATRRARLGLRGASFVAALVLLALLGTGDERTDVLAHALGFTMGALLVLPLRRWPVRSARLQWLAGLGALSLPLLAWAWALLADAGRYR